MTSTDEPYDQAFFAGQAARSLQSAMVVLGRVFALLRPRRVLDVGCGVGPWLRAATDLGATEVLGLDGDYVDRTALMMNPDSFIPADLATASLQTVLGERAATPFDLVICMEVAEHLPHDRAPSLVADLTLLGDVVLFSAAVPFQYGKQHINEQWPEFWSILFRAHGFACFDCLRAHLWADIAVDWWYAQNALLFAREGSGAAAALPQEVRVESRGLSLVHPENLLANLLGLPRRYRQDASAEELNDFRSLVAANLRRDAELPLLEAPARAVQAGPQAHNVFPWTRTEISEPGQEIADLGRRVEEVSDLLRAAERACASAHEALAAERTARLQFETLLRSTRERLQGYAAARMFAESRLAELTVTSAQQQQELAAARRDLAAIDTARQEAAEADALHDAPDSPAVTLDQHDVSLEAPRCAVEPDVSNPSVIWRVGQRIRVIGRWLPGPMKDALRGPARLAWRRLHDVGQAPLTRSQPVPESAVAPTAKPLPPVVPVPDKPQIKCNGRVIGEVNWWTLAAAVTRLRRFEIFDGEEYLRRNPEVAAARIDPYTHFIQSGALEGRAWVDPEELARVMSGFTLFEHALQALPASQENDADLPDLVADIRHIGIYVSSYGNSFMEEIAEDLAADLHSVGVTVDLLDENSSIDQRPPVCLFVAPHEFFLLGRGPQWVRDDVFATGFMFGTEQVQTKWFNLALPFILISRGLVDICPQTAALFQRTDMAALHVLSGVRQQPRGLTERDKQHPLYRVLPPAAQLEPHPQRPFLQRPIDISFFGNSSPRRDRFFARNAAFLAEYETFNYCRRSDRGPILSKSDEGALTRLAGHVSGHSKIALNIHREEFGYFEWHRMVRLGMCSGSLVVSDPCLPHPSFIANEHYLQESTRRIPDLLEWLLTTEDGNREAERIRCNVDDLITNSFDRRHTMSQLLRFLSKHRSRDGEASTG